MIRKTSEALAVASLFLVVAGGCTSERDRIAAALDRDLAKALAGCIPVAWDHTTEVNARRASCVVGDPRLSLPFALEVLSHTGHVRVASETPGAHRLRPYGKQYELVAGQPIATVTTRTETTTALCWADVRARIVEMGPTEVRDGHLGVDVWFDVEVTPPLWAERLGKRDRMTLQQHTRWARSLTLSGDTVPEHRRPTAVRRASYRDGNWLFERLGSRGTITWGTSERRILWGAPPVDTSPPRIARAGPKAGRYRLFANGFEEGGLSAWKTTESEANP